MVVCSREWGGCRWDFRGVGSIGRSVDREMGVCWYWGRTCVSWNAVEGRM